MEHVIRVEHVDKIYKLYRCPQDRVKEAFSLTHKSYHGDFKALSDISFTVEKGETLGVIGKNGAGKSTLLKLITGVATPTNGSIEVNGQVSALLELGTGFNPEFNGFQNIYLNGTIRGFSKEEMDERVEEIVSLADIGEYISQPVKTYSSGMFARLAFAVMVSFRPEILIIDEALSVGDVFFQQKCNTYMKEKMKGVTKLLVTHDMNSIANMADKVILLDKGRMVRFGDPLDVIEEYLKRMHTDTFAQKKNKTVPVHAQPQEEAGNASETVRLNPAECRMEQIKGDGEEWEKTNAQELGGQLDAEILSYKAEVNGRQISVVKPNDRISIFFKLHAKRDISDVIVGYTVKDKYGNAVTGENSIGSQIALEGIEGGRDYIYRLMIRWPEIQGGDYFITLGVGEGTDQMVHTIQCWAHNVIHVQSIALVPMHGIINNRILEITRQ